MPLLVQHSYTSATFTKLPHINLNQFNKLLSVILVFYFVLQETCSYIQSIKTISKEHFHLVNFDRLFSVSGVQVPLSDVIPLIIEAESRTVGKTVFLSSHLYIYTKLYDQLSKNNMIHFKNLSIIFMI